jgi:hypothetical protein
MGTDAVDVIALTPPVPDISGALIFCEDQTTSLDAGPFDEYVWSTGDITQSIIVDITGIFAVTVTDANGCTGSDEVSVEEVVVTPVITGQLSICTGDETTLSVGAFNTYLWSTGESSQFITVGGGGDYSITVTDGNGCTGTDAVFIEENDNLVPEILGESVLCEGTSTTLDAGIFDSHLWSTGETSQTISINAPGNYTVTVSDQNGCTGEDDIAITEVPNPIPTISGEQTFCSGASSILSVEVFQDYLWSTGEGSQSIEVFNSGIVVVTVTDNNGCTGTDEIILDEVVSPDPVVDGDLFLCPGESTTLQTSSFDSYLWSTGEETQSILITIPDVYGLTVTDLSGCTGITEVEVFGLAAPEVSISGSTTFCTGSGTLLDAGSFAGYAWSTGEVSSTIFVSIAGSYTVTVTDIDGCTGTDEISVAEEPELTAEILGDTIACSGEMVVLDAGPFATYDWSTDETSQTIDVVTSGIYSVTVSDGSGCTGDGEFSVIFNDVPDPVITGPDLVCSGDSAILMTNDFDAYLWSTGDTTNSITASEFGTYSLTVTDLAGCTGNTEVFLSIPEPPQPTIIGSNTFCDGDSTLLSADQFDGWLWSTGAITQSIVVYSSGTFTVTVTDESGCTGSTDHQVQVNDPVVPLINGQLSFCTGNSTTLSTDGFETYLWSNGSSDSLITVSESGTYVVTVTDITGCTGTMEVEVMESDSLLPVISGDFVICEGAGGVLNSVYFDHYVWSTGDTTNTILITGPGLYTVQVSDDSGCSGNSSIMISEVPNPEPEITGELMICAGLITDLDAGS